ncbi:MipA/OmpV family protein [Pseudidiomarina terrestris]|uniref:MipA/OmpV family protein n=1 Tax=Pseudidiomarina terrestris TaxID=2820060 RepID=A0AAW7QUV5_9GAMM|nr:MULTISPECIES: MipA/OmpV family protein [unclassified Pseudidiomarina]MDN7124001.1 MipA/OmpV family protein [Pseudidiomarina sp. 1APP75-32.1]MDN7127065.1 MipA/OmpV family protein [Pseudidiomarina sp. 1APR75-33.1]MDN7128258.1 MipA/OmpV family protein [Pseudidiomarina sp. 1APR75-15]MDN7135518.1 MipA/OmpV family protein [Pseudidiomarina sp. 1ASP75-5]MEA3586748.1 MipA/OmpV family protein [Pseudidiomarina sp. 1APP75-27a]
MKKLTGLLLLLCLNGLTSQAAFAQDEETALVPLPSLDDFTRGEDGWAFGLGLGVEYESAYEGSDEFGWELQPAGAVQWRSGDNIFYFAGEALGWRGLRADTWLLEATVGFDEGREEGDSDDGHLDGLGDQDEGAELVLQARRAFDSNWRNWLVGRVVTGGDGNLGLFGVGHRFGDQMNGTGSELNLVMVVHDSEYANKGFGIDANQAAASGLPETHLSGGLRSIGIDYNFRHYVNNNWQIYGEALFEYYSSEVRESPIARNNYEAEVGVGFIYVF